MQTHLDFGRQLILRAFSCPVLNFLENEIHAAIVDALFFCRALHDKPFGRCLYWGPSEYVLQNVPSRYLRDATN